MAVLFHGIKYCCQHESYQLRVRYHYYFLSRLLLFYCRFHREIKNCFDQIDFAKLKKVAVNVAGALWILRSEGIIHCDIKPGYIEILSLLFCLFSNNHDFKKQRIFSLNLSFGR
jgi:hypothetical protein